MCFDIYQHDFCHTNLEVEDIEYTILNHVLTLICFVIYKCLYLSGKNCICKYGVNQNANEIETHILYHQDSLFWEEQYYKLDYFCLMKTRL